MTKWFTLCLCILLLAACQGSTTQLETHTPIHTQVPTPKPTPTLVPEPTDTPAPTPVERSEPATPLDPYEQARRLGRGINLGNALEAPQEGEWGIVLKEEDLRLIAQVGFDTVRVPIRWSNHTLREPPYTISETFFERIDWVIETSFANGLNVVIDMHHYDELFEQPNEHEERFITMWRQIATRYRHMPDNLYYEPLNEPHGQLTAGRWNAILADAIAAIREVDGVHTLIVGGTEWGNIAGLGSLGIPEEETNAIATFHLYEPHMFTHQGAEWMDDTYATTGVQWPGPPETELVPAPAAQQVAWIAKWFEDYNAQPTEDNPAGPGPILDQLDWAVKYGERLQRPLWLGEFGAYSKADMQSRVNWTTFVREEAEKRGFPWAYWEFGAGFGVYDREAKQWNEELLRALIPGEE